MSDAVRSGREQLGGPFDLAVANAGGMPNHATKFSLADAEQIIRVNVLGMMYLFDAVIPAMIERRSGQRSPAWPRSPDCADCRRRAVLGEQGGHAGVPGSVAHRAEAPRRGRDHHQSRFRRHADDEKNRFRMPFLMTAEAAARIIADGLERAANG